MSLGTVFDRIATDVAAKVTANVDVPELIVFLINDFYYLTEIQQNKVLLLHLLQGVQSLATPTDTATLTLYLRRVVGVAAASPMAAVLIEAKYLVRFG